MGDAKKRKQWIFLVTLAATILAGGFAVFSSTFVLGNTDYARVLAYANDAAIEGGQIDSENQQQITKIDNSRYIPIHELVDTYRETTCPEGLKLIEDITKPEIKRQEPRKIPRIIHVTSKSRCVTPRMAKVINAWKNFSDHEFYFHNDAAMERLLFQKEWKEFPQLRLAIDCSNAMVERADLWRALVTWEYGGIYTDIDNIPKNFNASTTLNASTESYFEVERGGWLSQYFFAAAPRHPLMFLLVLQCWERLFTNFDLSNQYAPFLTGPGALKNAMKHFMNTQSLETNKADKCSTFEKVCQGEYTGLDNFTVTVAPRTSAVYRSVVPKKHDDYKAMNMTHFGHNGKLPQPKTSCLNYLYESSYKKLDKEYREGYQKYLMSLDTTSSSKDDKLKEKR